MADEKILVIEDEEDIQELLRYNLVAEGYNVSTVGCGEAGLEAVSIYKPDLILLDLMLPGLGGLEVCKRLFKTDDRNNYKIIMLTAKGEEADIVLGLEAGADDYVTKPFSPRILMARIRAVLRRGAEEEDGPKSIAQANLELNPDRHELRVDERLVELTATEFKLLYLLMKKPGRVYTRQQIIDNVMGEDYAVTERSVDVQVVGLRKKLGDSASYIDTIRGIGYRFKD